jgi:hypothetical protein
MSSCNQILMPDDDTFKRAGAYLAKMERSVQGQNGNGKLFAAAVAMAHGFALPGEQAVQCLLTSFNPECRPPWSEEEIRRAVANAVKKQHDKPRGYLLDNRDIRPAPRALPSKPAVDFNQKMVRALANFERERKEHHQVIEKFNSERVSAVRAALIAGPPGQ